SAASCHIVFGDTGSGGPGASAPGTGGSNTFTTQEKSSAGGTLTALGVSPIVTVVSADGTGTLTVLPTTVAPASTGNFLTFTYTAAAGWLFHGEIRIVIHAGWTTPDPNGFNPGGTNATCGDSPVTVAGNTIEVVNVTLTGGATCDIHYGISGFGTVTAPNSVGT